MKFQVNENRIAVRFDYDKSLISQVKDLHFRWDAVGKVWVYTANGYSTAEDMDAITQWLKKHNATGSWDDLAKLSSEVASGKYAKKDRIIVQSDCLYIDAKYDEALVEAIRQSFQNKFFEKDTKRWLINLMTPAEADNLHSIASKFGIEITPDAEQFIAKTLASMKQSIEASKASTTQQIRPGTERLYPFQRAGVEYILDKKRVLVADEMGLGKTVQALVAVDLLGAYPCLVICPASLKLNWAREAGRWVAGKTVSVLNGRAGNQDADIAIINYDILDKHMDWLKTKQLKSVIVDESHYIKNPKAQRTKNVQTIIKACQPDVVLLLTGTPVLNRPVELVPQLEALDILDPVFGGFWKFARRYCEPRRNQYGWEFKGASNLEELNQKLRLHGYLRREKHAVLTELPDKTRTVVPVEIEHRDEYEKAENDLFELVKTTAQVIAEKKAKLDALRDAKDPAVDTEARAYADYLKAQKAEILVRIEKLKQLTANYKLASAKAWIHDFLDTGEKLVVFAWHDFVIQDIASEFSDVCAGVITGSTPIEARQQAIDTFQSNPDKKIIVCNIKAGGQGITLTASSNVAFIELGWTPAEHDQAEDRVHRIGQKNAVNAWYLLADRTIDMWIYDLIQQKRSVVDATTEGAVAEDLAVIDELMTKILEKHGKVEVKA